MYDNRGQEKPIRSKTMYSPVLYLRFMIGSGPGTFFGGGGGEGNAVTKCLKIKLGGGSTYL